MRIVLLASACLVVGCAPSTSSGLAPATGRSGVERIVRVADRSGTIARVPLRWDDQTRTAYLDIDFDAAWSRLPGVLQGIGLSVDTHDEARGRVSHGGERVSRIDGKRLSTFLNCGIGTTAQPNANTYEVSLSYEVLIAKEKVGASLDAEMRIDATARPRDVRGSPLRCTSKGTLERLVFERLQDTELR